MKRTLTLNLKGVYFDQILAREKLEEYRLKNDYWQRRIGPARFSHLVLLRGYPKGGGIEGETRMSLNWQGYVEKQITHEHFGADEVTVYAISTVYRPTTLES